MFRLTLTGFAMQNRFVDRRNGDRRLGGLPNTGTSMTNGPARQTDGQAGTRDRRPWNFGIFCETTMPARTLRAWLENDANGKWDIRADKGGDPVASALNIIFEQESDSVSFVTKFSQ